MTYHWIKHSNALWTTEEGLDGYPDAWIERAAPGVYHAKLRTSAGITSYPSLSAAKLHLNGRFKRSNEMSKYREWTRLTAYRWANSLWPEMISLIGSLVVVALLIEGVITCI